MGNKNTKTKGDKKREHEEKKQLKKEQKAKKKSSKKSSISSSSNKKQLQQQLARGGFQNSGSEFDTDFESSHFTGADSESGVFHSAENLSASPYLDSCTKSERENSGILWRPSSPSTSRHPQVLSSRDFRDGFSLEACIPPDIARPITYTTDTTLSSCSGGGGGGGGGGGSSSGGGGSSTIGYRCHNNSSGSLRSKRSNSVKSHQQTPTFSRFKNDDVMSISTSSSQKSSQTGTGGYCTPLLNTPVFGRAAERSISPHCGLPLGRLHEPDRDSMDIVPLPYSPFDPEAKVFTTYNPTIVDRNNSQQQQQQQQHHHHPYFNQPFDYRNLPKPTSPHPQRRAFSPKMTSSPFKMISSDDSSSSPTTPIPQRKAAAALLSDLFKSSSKKKKKNVSDKDNDTGQTSPRSKKLPLWKTWERSSPKKSVDSNENRSSIFGTSRKTEKNKTSKKEQERQRSDEKKKKDRSSDSTLQGFGVDGEDGNSNTNGNGKSDGSDNATRSDLSHVTARNGDSNGSNSATENNNSTGQTGGELEYSLEHNRNSSPPVVKSAAFCIMRLEELERNIERTIKEKFPDAEPFLLRRSPPEEEFRGSKSLPTTPSLKKKLYVTRDLELSSDDVMSTDLHNLSEKLDNLSGATRYYDETFEDPTTRAKSPVIVRRFGARTRHASISPKIQRAKTAAIYNSPSEMERLAGFREESETANNGNSKSKYGLSKSNGICNLKYESQSHSKIRNVLARRSPSSSSSSSPKSQRGTAGVGKHQEWSRQPPDMRMKSQTTRPLLRQHRIEEPEKDDVSGKNRNENKDEEFTRGTVEEKVIVSTESAVFGSISPKLKRHLRGRCEQTECKDSNLGDNAKSLNRDDNNRCSKGSSSKGVVRRNTHENDMQTQAKTKRRSGSLDSLMEGSNTWSTSQRVAGDRDTPFSGQDCSRSRVLPIPLRKQSLPTDKNASTVSVKSRVRSINKSLSEEAAVVNQGRKLSVHEGSSSGYGESESIGIKSLPSSPTDRDSERSRNRMHGVMHRSSTDAKSPTGLNRFDSREKISWGNSASNPPRKHSADHVIFGTAVALPCRVYATVPTTPKLTSPTLSPTTGNQTHPFRFTHAQSSVSNDERNAETQECAKQERTGECQEERKEKDGDKEPQVLLLPTETKAGRQDDDENEDRIRKSDGLPGDRMCNKNDITNSKNSNTNHHNKHKGATAAQVDLEQVERDDENLGMRRSDQESDGDNNIRAAANTATASSVHNTCLGGPIKQKVGRDESRVVNKPEQLSGVISASNEFFHVSDSDRDSDNRIKDRTVTCTRGGVAVSSGSIITNISGSSGGSCGSVSSGSGGGAGGSGVNREHQLARGDDGQCKRAHHQQHVQTSSRLFQPSDIISGAGGDRTQGNRGVSGALISGGGDSANDNNNNGDGTSDKSDTIFKRDICDRDLNRNADIRSFKVGHDVHDSEDELGETLIDDCDDYDNDSNSNRNIVRSRGIRGTIERDDGRFGNTGIDSEIQTRDEQFTHTNDEDPVVVLKQPISQVISDMISVSKKQQTPPPQQQQGVDESSHCQHRQHEHPSPRPFNPSTPDIDNLLVKQAVLEMSTPSSHLLGTKTLEESTVVRESNPSISCAANDQNSSIEHGNISTPEIDNKSNNRSIKETTSVSKQEQQDVSSDGTEDSDMEMFMKSVKECVIPKVFGPDGDDGLKGEAGKVEESSEAATIGRQAPPPPSPNTLDKLIAAFDEADEDEEDDDLYDDGDCGGGGIVVGAAQSKPMVNLALTRQNEMKEFTNRVINRLSDLLGSHSGREYYNDDDDDDDVFADDTNDEFLVESGAHYISVSKKDDEENNVDADESIKAEGANRLFQNLEITNSSFNQDALDGGSGGSLITTPKLAIPNERVLYSRFSTSSSLSTSTSSSSSSDLFGPPPPQHSNTMPGFEGFEKGTALSTLQSKPPPGDYFVFDERRRQDQHHARSGASNPQDYPIDDEPIGYNRVRSAHTRSYHSDDDVARGGGIPEYYDDKPLWNKRQKPPGHMSVKIASVRRRERRERWLKKRKRNRTDLVSVGSSEVASEQSSNHGRSRLSLDGDFDDDEEVTNLSTQTQKGAMGSGILTSPKYTKPIMPFFGSREVTSTPPQPADEELIVCRNVGVESATLPHQEYKYFERGKEHGTDSKSDDFREGEEERREDKFDKNFLDKSYKENSNLEEPQPHYDNNTDERGAMNTRGVIKIPGLEETFDELMSVQQILEGFQVRAPSAVSAPPATTHNNDGNKNTSTHSTNTRFEPKPKCMPLTVENITSMKDMYRETGSHSGNNFNVSGRLSRLSNTNRTESDLDIYSEYRDDASTDSNLYADDEEDDNDDDGNDPYTTAEDDLDASVGDTDLENNVVVSCTFYNSNTYQQQPPNTSHDLGNRTLVFTASPGTSRHQVTSSSSTLTGDVGGAAAQSLTTPNTSFRSSTEEDMSYYTTGAVFGGSTNTGSVVGDSKIKNSNNNNNNNNNNDNNNGNTYTTSYDANSQSFTSSAYHTISHKNSNNENNNNSNPNRSAIYVRSNSAPGAYTGQQFSVFRDATSANTGSYHGDMGAGAGAAGASNVNNSDEEFWHGRPAPFERSYSFHQTHQHQNPQQALMLTPVSGTGPVSRTFQNAREQMMDIQHHLQALRRQMEGLQDDLATSTSYTLTPDFSACDSK